MNTRGKVLVAALLGGLLASLGACNTVKGVGRDIQSVGEAGARAHGARSAAGGFLGRRGDGRHRARRPVLRRGGMRLRGVEQSAKSPLGHREP